MKKDPIFVTLLLAAMAFMAAPAWAAGDQTAVAKSVTGKAAPKVKLIDINSADAKTLMTLPDISAADAEKIIAGRPYGSKSWLVTKSIVSADKYPVLKDLVVAKQVLAVAGKAGTVPTKANKPVAN